MARSYTNPFAVDYTNLEEVKKFADELGSGQVVFKHPDRNNYNITHAERTDRYREEWVVYRTGVH